MYSQSLLQALRSEDLVEEAHDLGQVGVDEQLGGGVVEDGRELDLVVVNPVAHCVLQLALDTQSEEWSEKERKRDY